MGDKKAAPAGEREPSGEVAEDIKVLRGTIDSMRQIAKERGESDHTIVLRMADTVERVLNHYAAQSVQPSPAGAGEPLRSTFGDEWTHLQWLKALGYETSVGCSPFDSYEDITSAVENSPLVDLLRSASPVAPPSDDWRKDASVLAKSMLLFDVKWRQAGSDRSDKAVEAWTAIMEYANEVQGRLRAGASPVAEGEK